MRLPVLAQHPHAGASLDLGGFDAEVAAGSDQHLHEAPDVPDDIAGFGQLDDGIAHELARTVPGDLAAAVDVDDRCAVDRPLEVECAFARGVDRRVLEEQLGVRCLVRRAGRLAPPLLLPRQLVVDEPEVVEDEAGHGSRVRPPRDSATDSPSALVA